LQLPAISLWKCAGLPPHFQAIRLHPLAGLTGEYMTAELRKSILVTGATGFVGSNLVEALIQKGDSVVCLVRGRSDTRFLQKLPVQMVIADLENKEALRQAVRGIRMVYHIAGLIKAAKREDFFRTNQTGTRRILEALAESNPEIHRFVHVSSLAAGGPGSGSRGLNEADPANPISWYGESKLKSEEEARSFANVFPVTILRPSAVYGPWDRETLLLFRMIKHGFFFTPGRQVRHFSLIHVRDLVEACMLAGESNTRSGEVFYVSRPEIYGWEDVGRAISRAIGKKYIRISFPEWVAVAAGGGGDLWSSLTGRPATLSRQKVKELLQPYWLCDSSKAYAELKFNPRTSLEAGIRETAAWYINRGWL
jgi:nucleoside-diphosphate-sugar epimerase